MRGDLPFACNGGACGTCRARVTEDEVATGFVLACQSRPVTVDFGS
ncbi:2Fe-2S iron-sulfur cluster-binding protein [Pseudonocardia yunnanensis]|uniref:2Fe-2S iron-sulfur cluster-binding protein n=1 Tax=Pseudonocardia yunnanensis TaxID=58107 RepID=A0ABW4F310_9PSEU